MDPVLHGGRLAAARRLFPAAPSPFIDLSTGINPHPYPLAPFSVAALTRLPEPESEEALRHLAASAYGAPSPDHVVAAPGSQILISLLPTLLACQHVAILSPTYGEHAAAWRLAGATVVTVPSVAVLMDQAAAGVALVLCNPNNPDGRRIDADTLAMLAARCAGQGGTLVVDEAFADLEPDVPLAGSLLPSAGLVVLRSFGKCHGLAGLRLGFMLADIGMAGRMRSLLGPWAVSGPAIEAGLQALSDESWRDRMSHALDHASQRLDRLLTEAGLVPVGGTRLFRLAETPDASAIFESLGRAGLLVRRFDDQPHRLRFGMPPDEEACSRLRTALG
jgi:cobalamin biosynthetic protein CobC